MSAGRSFAELNQFSLEQRCSALQAERDRLRALNAELLAACNYALATLNDMTTEQFSRGEDRSVRDKMAEAISRATGEVPDQSARVRQGAKG